MAEDKTNQDNKKQQETEATKKAAVNAAKMYGGPVGMGVDLASKTKLGNAILNKGAEQLNRNNPGLGKLTSAMNRGNSDLLNNNKGLGGNSLPKDELPRDGVSKEEGLPKQGLDEESSNQKKGGLSQSNKKENYSNRENQDDINSETEGSGSGDFSSQALNFFKKHWKKIVPVIGGFLLMLILIITVVVIVGSAGAGVSEFFTKIGDGLIGFFTEDEQEKMNEYYNKLQEVKKKMLTTKQVCIDENLITATLTVDIDASSFIEEGQVEVESETIYLSEDTEDPNYYENTTTVDYNRMKKEVALLANMQVKTIRYGHDNDLHGGCLPLGEATREEVVNAENESRFNPSGLNWWNKINIAGDFVSDSPELVAMHDKQVFSAFFTKKDDEETNYEFRIFTPAYHLECSEYNTNGACIKEKQVCPKLPAESYELSIGDLATMENSVYYWNLVNSFIPNYYEEYLPSEEGEERDAAIKKIAEEIYLLYTDLGEGLSCNALYNTTQNYNYSCVNANGVVANNTKVELLQCKDGTRFEPIAGESLVDLENYITGVVYAENGGSSNYEALKAQAVAARTYLLKNNDGKSTAEDGSTVLKIRNCTERQVYCDPANGCWSDSNTAGATVHSGQLSGKPYNKKPLPSDSKVYQAVQETIGEVVYDTDGKLISSGYKASDQRRWNSMTDSDYLAMLATSYSNLGQLASECIGAPGDWANWKQAGSSWSNLKIGSKTIGQVGCLMTSVAIQIARSGVNTILGADFNPGTFMEAHKANGGFSGNIFNWDVTAVAPNFIHGKRDGGSARVYINKNNAASIINDYMNQGYYIILNLHHPGEHHVAVDHVEGNNIYMFDPGNYGNEVFSASWGGLLTLDSIDLYYVR